MVNAFNISTLKSKKVLGKIGYKSIFYYSHSTDSSLKTESLLKLMKNAFYFTLKALFVLKTFKFLSGIFGHAENQLG